ncbi:MAG: zf-HC2 domain-containing protein [Chitinispirillaceae bacterium]|nr:zf-HC2 domain-containing protein [Chitinispirillaceae bacterium]
MECCKWEELGLLYSANELDDKRARDFEEHLKECEECRKELYYYREEKKRFFTEALLGDSPSQKTDVELLRLCSHLRRKGSFVTLMPSLLRRAVVPLSLFAVAFVSVGYVMMNMENARQLNAAASHNAVQAVEPSTLVASVPSEAAGTAADSAADSARFPDINFAKTRGNLQGQGVIPVDLKNK